MEERKLDKLNELLRRFVGEYLRKEMDFEDALVTVSSVVTTSNRQESTVGVTVFPFEKSARVLEILNKNIYETQKAVNRGLSIRPVPKIIFKIDESEEKGDRILRTLKNIEE